MINNSKDDFVIIGNGFLLQYKGNETEATSVTVTTDIVGDSYALIEPSASTTFFKFCITLYSMHVP